MSPSMSEFLCLLFFLYSMCFFNQLGSISSTIDEHNNELYIVQSALISNIPSVSFRYFNIDKHNIEIYIMRSAMISNIICCYCLRTTCSQLYFDVNTCGTIFVLCLLISMSYFSLLLYIFTQTNTIVTCKLCDIINDQQQYFCLFSSN